MINFMMTLNPLFTHKSGMFKMAILMYILMVALDYAIYISRRKKNGMIWRESSQLIINNLQTFLTVSTSCLTINIIYKNLRCIKSVKEL